MATKLIPSVVPLVKIISSSFFAFINFLTIDLVFSNSLVAISARECMPL
ncbi:uncharacterized protein METZ01_LOCUS30919 [marine metagenome]|uniref:Uncharacterized protein n=1 Tax=marine metagenome TaxID=408172 RepID=A0A381QFE8_9ZZZZ